MQSSVKGNSAQDYRGIVICISALLIYIESYSKEENSIDPISDEKSITEFSIPKMLEEAFISEENRSTS